MKFRVLTIDGGGMRGIIPAAILAYIERQIQEISKKPNARLIDYVDFISGTSTGSITAAAMLLPNEKGRAKYSMDNIVDFYIRLGENVFLIPKKYRWKTLHGFIGPMIPEENIEKAYLHIFDHHKMKEFIKPAIIPAYDIDKRQIILYTTNDAAHKYQDFFVKDVIRGTTAVPYMFRPGYFRNGIDIHTIIDGGLVASNPSLIAWLECIKQGYMPNEIVLFSFGTGTCKQIPRYKFDEAKNWGRIKWFNPMLNIVKSSNVEMTNYMISKIYEVHHIENNYIRINPLIQYSSKDIYNPSQTNIQNLLRDAQEYIDENKEELNKLAQRLFDCKD